MRKFGVSESQRGACSVAVSLVRERFATPPVCIRWRCSVRTTHGEKRTDEKRHEKGHGNVPFRGFVGF